MSSSARSLVLTPVELRAWLEMTPALRLLDVRTPGEFENAHIQGAYNVPVDLLGEHAREVAAVQAPVVLLCQSGMRAHRGEEVLRGFGMRNVHVLEGGMNGWLAAALPVERRRPRMSLERQVRIGAGALVAAGSALALLLSPAFAALPLAVGCGLVFAGITDVCMMGMLLARFPWNRGAACDVPAMVRALAEGTHPPQPAR